MLQFEVIDVLNVEPIVSCVWMGKEQVACMLMLQGIKCMTAGMILSVQLVFQTATKLITCGLMCYKILSYCELYVGVQERKGLPI